MLICPVCAQALIQHPSCYRCGKGHSFDIAKEGYVNLLRSSKNGDLIGDDKYSARSRRDFLNKGYYSVLKDVLVQHFRNREGNLLDICCGEGYYTSSLAKNQKLQVYGFDISKEMVRLAAKRGGATYFVANLASIPVADHSVDYAIHLFAPFQEQSFCKVLKPGGRILTVIPGKNHLYGLKQAIYNMPYFNDEKLPDTAQLKLIQKEHVSSSIHLASQEDIQAVFRMTPYYFHTSEADKKKLEAYSCLDTDIHFILAEYENP